MEALTPRQIVEELDKYIIGQEKAKKAVAVALRNRYRRKKLSPELQEEIIPKNILMMGPTGVGKTEIARRLARLANAPFVKVEATKFTEVGYVGRDVEGMVRDLVETAIRMVKNERGKAVEVKALQHAEERILDLLYPLPKKQGGISNPFSNLFGGNNAEPDEEQGDDLHHQRLERAKNTREKLAAQLANKELEERVIEIEVEETGTPVMEVFTGSGMEEVGANFQDMFSNLFPKKRKKRKVTVADARKIFAQEETQKLIDMDEVISEAVNRSEQEGIIFIDEIDKIAGKNASRSGPDVSREGVQRDILPIIEGSTVVTKYGPVKTDHILFIAAGAFHISKPSELIPELQGRFPIRVELESLSEDDFCHILTRPKNALLKQYKALLETEDIEIEFTESGIREIARISSSVNAHTENIGARRLHTVLEKLLEDLSFEAGAEQKSVQIDVDYVRSKLNEVVKDQDLSKYIL